MNFDNGLYFAVAFTEYNNEREILLDPSIGELVFKAYQWGLDANNDVSDELITLKSHTCTRDELGLTNSNEGNFLPFNDVSTENTVDRYSKKFQCLDKDEMHIYGDWSSHKGR